MVKKISIGSIVEIVWLDAIGKSSVHRDEVESVDPKDLLVLTSTYGVYYKDDGVAIMILQEDSQDGVDYTVIPKNWIVKINKLVKK